MVVKLRVWLFAITAAAVVIFYLTTLWSDQTVFARYEAGTDPRQFRKFRNVGHSFLGVS